MKRVVCVLLCVVALACWLQAFTSTQFADIFEANKWFRIHTLQHIHTIDTAGPTFIAGDFAEEGQTCQPGSIYGFTGLGSIFGYQRGTVLVCSDNVVAHVFTYGAPILYSDSNLAGTTSAFHQFANSANGLLSSTSGSYGLTGAGANLLGVNSFTGSGTVAITDSGPTINGALMLLPQIGTGGDQLNLIRKASGMAVSDTIAASSCSDYAFASTGLGRFPVAGDPISLSPSSTPVAAGPFTWNGWVSASGSPGVDAQVTIRMCNVSTSSASVSMTFSGWVIR